MIRDALGQPVFVGLVLAAVAFLCEPSLAQNGTLDLPAANPSADGAVAVDTAPTTVVPGAVEVPAGGPAGATDALTPGATLSPNSGEPPVTPADAADSLQGLRESVAPEKVSVGVYVNDIQELDFKTHTYGVDLYVWFRWRSAESNPSTSMEFMNRSAPSDHVRESGYEQPKELPNGDRYTFIRNQGRFTAKMVLETYPFDRQNLRIDFEDTEANTDAMSYVPDDTPVTLNPAIEIPGFHIGTPRLEIAAHRYPTNFGDPTVGSAEAYSRASVVIPITRPPLASAAKTFLPIALVVLCAVLVLLLRTDFVDARIGLGITALLTMVALQLSGTTGLPDVDYLTLVDKVFLASYAFIMCVLIRVVWASWADRDRVSTVQAAVMDRICLLILLAAYAGALAVMAGPVLQG